MRERKIWCQIFALAEINLPPKHTLVGKPENELLGEINTEKELAKLPPNAGQSTLCTILSRRILLCN